MKRVVIMLYIVVVAVLAAATIFERYKGTDFTSENVYGAWWFSTLWVLLTATAVVWFISKRVKRLSTIVLHLSFVFILTGGLITHLTAKRGVIMLRQGIPTNECLTRDMHILRMPFSICLDHFEIKYYEGTNEPSDYISHVTIDGKPFTISMNQIVCHKNIRLYQCDYDQDLRGSILTMNCDPWGIPVTYCSYALLFLSLMWMLIDPKGGFRQQLSELRQRRFPFVALALFLLACFIFLLVHFMEKYALSNHPLPVLNSPLLPVHVSTIMMAYVLLLVAIFIRAMLYPALALLCFGIFIGAIWANVSWGNYWSWDPKETWALITLMVYAVPAHKTFHFSPFNYRLYMTLAFLAILMTYFGVNYFLGGMHSYA